MKFFDNNVKLDMFDRWNKANNRVLLLDYDGTLVPFASLPSQAKPSVRLLEILEKLSANERNIIFVISGRDSKTLETWLGYLPLNIIAEHGAKIKLQGKGWEDEAEAKNNWKPEVKEILKQYVEQCEGSFIEEKTFSLAWHYRNANPAKAKQKAKDLLDKMTEYARDKNLQVISGNKVIEVRNKGIDKGIATSKILKQHNHGFVLAIGDDRTDEDMFETLESNPDSYTIKVGTDKSSAKYNLYTPYMVLSLLEMLSNMAT